MRLSSLVGFSLFALISDATLQIVPGATWTAVRSVLLQLQWQLTFLQTNTGQHIQAHGGGVIKDGEKWYW
jgi:hypothetical protein